MNDRGEDTPRRAVALSYDGRRAPTVSASGEHALAEEIIAIARAHDIPLFENPELSALLSELELGEEIPEVLYRCIAQIIAFAYSMQGRVPPGWAAHDDGVERLLDES